MILNNIRPKIGSLVIRTATQSLTNNISTPIIFQGQIWSGGPAFWNSVANPERLTIPTGFAGYYLSYCGSAMANNGVGTRAIFFEHFNSSGVFIPNRASYQTRAIDNEAAYTLTLGVRYFNDGDYIVNKTYQSSGGNLNALAGQTFMSLIKVG